MDRDYTYDLVLLVQEIVSLTIMILSGILLFRKLNEI